MSKFISYLIEFDDLHPNPVVDCLSLAEDLLKKYPQLILNFFVPPMYSGESLRSNKDWCSRLRDLVDSNRICLGIHGHLHSPQEFLNKSYADAVSSIKASESILNSAGLSYYKIFRGPHWAINEPTCEALVDLGYTHLYSHVSYNELNEKFKDKIKIARYNWNLKDDYPHMENPMAESSDICVAHGHTSKHFHLSCGNSIWDVYPKIEKFIEDYNPEFLRLDQYV